MPQEQDKPKIWTANLVGKIEDDQAKQIHSLVDHLEREGEYGQLRLTLQTTGGSILDAFAIHDRLLYSPLDVEIRVAGYCMSAGVLILQAADQAHRLSYPNARFMIHPASGQLQYEKLDDARVLLQFQSELEKSGVEIQAARAGINPDTFYEDSRRLNFMTAEEALRFGEHGLIDGIIAANNGIKYRWDKVLTDSPLLEV
jgi:ATP-dependent Clp endopeptidase proteolytic subunit ClpP